MSSMTESAVRARSHKWRRAPAMAPAGRRRPTRTGGWGIAGRILLVLWVLWSIAPIYWLLQMSMQSNLNATASPPVWGWFLHPTFQPYIDAIGRSGLISNLINSLMTAFGTVVVALGTGVPAAYALVRWPMRHQQHYEFWVLTTRMAPPLAVALPFFILFRKVHLIDTVAGLILMHSSIVLAIVTWMLMETFRSIPVEVEQAALLDGCTAFGAFRRVALPLARPGVVGAAVLAFLLSWNEFFMALIVTSNRAVTGPVGLYNFLGYAADEVNQLAAGSLVLLVPAFLVVWLFQRQLVTGLSFGAVKQ